MFTNWCDVTAINPSYGWTAGAIISTPWDLLKLEDTVFETDKLLNPGTKNKWYTFSSSDIHPGWKPIQYGVGALMQPERSYGTARGHGGAFPGYIPRPPSAMGLAVVPVTVNKSRSQAAPGESDALEVRGVRVGS